MNNTVKKFSSFILANVFILAGTTLVRHNYDVFAATAFGIAGDLLLISHSIKYK